MNGVSRNPSQGKILAPNAPYSQSVLLSSEGAAHPLLTAKLSDTAQLLKPIPALQSKSSSNL